LSLRKVNPDRLAALDGMRGLAAIAVALMHGSSIFNLPWIPEHAYLAVDFFFLLSGYVLARAFDRRLQQGWAIGFLQRRLIRLYPLIVLGSLIGVCELIIHGVRPNLVSMSQGALDLASSLLVIPTPPIIAPHWRMYPVDPPLWSLLFEIAANTMYAAMAPWLPTRQLWMLVGLSGLGFGIALFMLNGGDFGLRHFEMASLRVAFSFSLGVALHRTLGPDPKKFAVPFVSMPAIFAVMMAVLLAPKSGGWPYDLVAVYAVFPALLMLAITGGAGGPRLQSVCLVLGELSYSLYAIHMPFFLMVYGASLANSALAGRIGGLTVSLAAITLISLFLARFYDQPVRRWALHRLNRYHEARSSTAVARRGKVLRLFTEPGYAARVVRARCYSVMRNRLGMAAPMVTEDRRILEQVIFEHYRNDPAIKTILFVGCDSYTAHYQRRYFSAHDFWTMDPNPNCRRFGANRHVMARLEHLNRHFPDGLFDLIICNGVYGWGLNHLDDCDAALSQCHSCLTPRGHLLIGWNDVPGRDPAPLSAVPSLSRFCNYDFPGLGGSRYLTDTPYRHTYWFFRRIDLLAEVA
jgi:peptidoglycan/LPS O-acetylase OafA/YrhL